MGRVRIMESIAERRKVANNLYRILAKLENRSMRKAVLLKAGLGGDSTKRLYYYAIDPTDPDEKQIARAKKATKKINKYAALAAEAAKLSGFKDDHFLPELVEGTQYALLPQAQGRRIEDAEAEAWHLILTTVLGVTQGIAAKHNLKQQFELINEAGIGWNYRSELQNGRSESYASTQLMPRPALVAMDAIPPCPDVFLGELRDGGSPIPCKIFLEVDHGGSGASEAEKRLYARIKAAGLETSSVEVLVEPLFAVWLCLLPYGRPTNIVPVLHLMPRARVRAAQAFDTYAQFGGSSYVKGQILGEYELPIGPEGSCDIGERVAAWDQATDAGLIWYGSGHFNEEDLESYSQTIHSRLESSQGALIVAFDEHVREYLDKEMVRPSEPDAYCEAVETAISESGAKKEERKKSALYDEDSMTAALGRSIFDAPDYASLPRLLDQAAEEFCSEANSQLQKHRELERAENAKIEPELARVRARAEVIARVFGEKPKLPR
jgi:hypothetical protein